MPAWYGSAVKPSAASHAAVFPFTAMSVMGMVLALIVFNVTAFAVPLLFDRRALLVGAVTASVRAVFTNPAAMLAWAVVLGVAVIATIHIPPLLIVVLPCLAFASDLLYLEVFPPA